MKRCVELQRIAAAKAGGAVATEDGSPSPSSAPVTDTTISSNNHTQHQQHFCAMHQQELAAGIAVGNGVARGDAQRGLVSGMVAEVDKRGLRVPCPLNPNHTVYERDVQRHIKICPDRRFIVTEESYYLKSLHAFAGCFSYDDVALGATLVGTNNNSSGRVVQRSPVVPITAEMEADLEMKAAIVTASKEVKAGSNIKDQQDTKRNAKLSAATTATASAVQTADKTEVDAGHDEHMPIEDDDDAGGSSSTSTTPKKRYTHRDLPPEVLVSLIDRIHAYYNEHVSKYIEVLEDGGVAADEETGGSGSGGQQQQNQKHDPQHDRLHKLILPLLAGGGGGGYDTDEDALTVVEMGAGKAGLGASLVENLLKPTIPPTPTSSPSTTTTTDADTHPNITRALRVLVSDLGGFRRKADAGAQALIARSLSPSTTSTSTAASSFPSTSVPPPKVLSYKRLRCNLKDLNLPAALLHNNANNNSEPAAAVAASAAGSKRERDEEGTTATSGCPKNSDEFISIGKHLCGACTDFAISCTVLGSTTSSPTSSSMFESSSLSLLTGGVQNIPKCKGLVIATCCHHRCEPQHMCFPQSVSMATSPPSSTSTSAQKNNGSGIIAGSSAPFFIPTLEELTKSKNNSETTNYNDDSAIINTLEELQALISITSWAVSGAHAVPNPRHRQAGRNAKRIIDFHRAMFLERILNSQGGLSQRYRVRMVEYINAGITPENVALVVDVVDVV